MMDKLKPLWSDGYSEKAFEKFNKDTCIYNLYEDIQCLKEQLSEKPSSCWISVDERLPEIETNVLTSVLLSNGEYSTPGIEFMFHKLGKPNQDALIWTGGGADVWQPLPSAPLPVQHKTLKACIDVYMDIHVSELHKFTQSVKDCWKIGQEGYSLNQEK